MQDNEKIPLSALRQGQAATIDALYLHGAMRQRLQDLGWIPGTSIRRLQTAGSGDPTAYQVRGAVIALRQRDAKMILVRVA